MLVLIEIEEGAAYGRRMAHASTPIPVRFPESKRGRLGVRPNMPSMMPSSMPSFSDLLQILSILDFKVGRPWDGVNLCEN